MTDGDRATIQRIRGSPQVQRSNLRRDSGLT
jgi:hypothetical protein